MNISKEDKRRCLDYYNYHKKIRKQKGIFKVRYNKEEKEFNFLFILMIIVGVLWVVCNVIAISL